MEEERGYTSQLADDAAPQQGDMRARTLELLEFDVVRRQVAGRTAFFPARQLAMQMTPSYWAYEVEELQRETAEGRALLDEVGEVNLHTTSDTATAVTRAALGGILTGLELLAVADSLEVHRRARAGVLKGRTKAPLLAEMAEGIADLQELRRQIRARIGERGEVVDDATHTLRAVRGQMREAYGRVTTALTRIIQSSVGQEALQDQVISMRGERLVVQVKAEMRHRVPGIVHDASNTGATLFIEPFSTVELGNNWRELSLEEEREVRRVLRDLSELVGRLADDIRRSDALTARLDFILARARHSMSMRGVSALKRRGTGVGSRGKIKDSPVPHSSLTPDPRPPTPPDMALRLLNARHPMLGRAAIPININIGPGWSALVITGPNTGGKTVAMKTVGLLALMHQSGLHIPADEGSALPVFDGVFADVGDQQSIEQSVSTFSSHMRNVTNILAEVSPSSLVLLDELGTSTDPEEGSALAKAILGHLAALGVSTIATTHHRTVAAYVEVSPGMMNASVQLDSSTLRPTYVLTMGIPGRSYAMAVAASLGLPREIMDKAQALLEPQHLRFEDWLNELQGERDLLKTRLAEAEQARAQAEALRQQLGEQMDYLVSHREDILDSVRRDALARYEDIRQTLRRAEAALSWGPRQVGEAAEAKVEVARVGRELAEQKRSAPPPMKSGRVGPRPLAVGDRVDIRGLNLQGTVAALPEQGREADVNIGKVHLKVELSRLSRVEEEPGATEPDVQISLGPSLDSMELDLRGLRAEESLMRLEEFLDRAVRDGLSTVRIIHGRGTGALRNAVREHLRRHPLARSFGPEKPERGGNGATLVQLA